MKREIYFAHPSEKYNSKREKRIIEILESRKYKVINPFDYQNPKDIISENRTYSSVIPKDKKLLEKCDEIFCWYPKGYNIRTIGTTWEMAWAYRDGKYITVLTFLKYHPFLEFYANKVYYCYQAFLHDNEYIFK